MLIEDWDRMLLGMTKRKYDKMKRKRKLHRLLDDALEMTEGIVFVVSIVMFALLCTL